MQRIIICLLIVLLSACSNKKPDTEDAVPDDADIYMAEAESEFEDLYIHEYEDDGDFLAEDKAELYNRVKHLPVVPYYRFKAKASSELPGYPVKNLVDHTWNSWAAGGQDNGIGEYFFLDQERRYNRINIAGFVLKNGHGQLDHYNQNNRVKSLKIYADDDYIETIAIKDSFSFEQYIFEKPVKDVFDGIRFVIDDVYPGTEFNNTYVAEVALLTDPVNATQFYESILLWFYDPSYYKLHYESVSKQIASVPDTENLMLWDYLPFDIPYNRYFDSDTYKEVQRKLKTATLDGDSSLKLNDNLPRIDGSTAMYPLYSSFVRAVYPQIDINWEGDSEYTDGYYVNALYEWAYYPSKNLEYYWRGTYGRPSDREIAHLDIDFKSIVQSNTTPQAFQRLIDGEADIIFCYAPSEAEKNAAAAKGKQFSLTPIAYDAFVFIVNEKNRLNDITQQQIRDIYSGRITNWKYITGVDEPIIAYQRPENSGSQTTLQSIMQGRRLMRTILDSEYIVRGMSSMIKVIASDYYNYNSAIGYTFLFYLTQMADGSGVKALAVDGVAPTRQTIQNKKYPFAQTVYAITIGNESENAKKFIEWILSAQGQELVAKTGYTPVK